MSTAKVPHSQSSIYFPLEYKSELLYFQEWDKNFLLCHQQYLGQKITIEPFEAIGASTFMFILGHKWLLAFGMLLDTAFIHNSWLLNESSSVCNKYVVYFPSKWKHSIHTASQVFWGKGKGHRGNCRPCKEQIWLAMGKSYCRVHLLIKVSFKTLPLLPIKSARPIMFVNSLNLVVKCYLNISWFWQLFFCGLLSTDDVNKSK